MEMKENGQDIIDIKYELSKLPPYARDESKTFPLWKIKFIDQNRECERGPYSMEHCRKSENLTNIES